MQGKTKSKTFRKVFRKTPGGRVVTQFKLRKPRKASCARCGTQLAGVLRGRAVTLRTAAKTKKRPQRPFGGVLCSRCMRAEIKQGVRNV